MRQCAFNDSKLCIFSNTSNTFGSIVFNKYRLIQMFYYIFSCISACGRYFSQVDTIYSKTHNAMADKDITRMSADEIIKLYGCTTLEDFDDVLTYEINKQYMQQ